MIPIVPTFVKRLSISVDDAMHLNLKIHAAKTDRSMNEIVVDAVRAYFRKNENVDPNSAANKLL